MSYKIILLLICFFILAACGRTEENEYPEYTDYTENDIDTLCEVQPEYSQYSWSLAIAPTFDFVTDFHDGLASVLIGDWEDGHWGIIDTEGNFVIEPIYNQLGNFHIFSAVERAMSVSGESRSFEFFPLQLGENWGVLNRNGNEIIPFIYSEIVIFNNDLARIVTGTWENNDKLYGLINLRTGEKIVPPMYNAINFPSQGLMEVRVGDWISGLSGFIDESGTKVIPAIYHFAHGFEHNMAVVGFGSDWSTARWGVIDREGREIIPANYHGIRIFSENAIALSHGDWSEGPWSLVDRNGNEILPPLYTVLAYVSDELILLSRELWDDEPTFGLTNFVTGEEIIPRGTFSSIHAHMNTEAYDHLITVIVGWHPDQLSGVIDASTGQIVIDAIYHQTFVLNSDMIGVRHRGDWYEDWNLYLGGRWGIINRTGQEIAPMEFASVMPFGTDLAVIATGDIPEFWDPTESKRGIINSNGDLVLPLEYTHIDMLSEGLAVVNIGGEWLSWGGGGIEVSGGRWGFIKESGDIVIPVNIEFEMIRAVSENMAAVRQDGRWGFIRINR